MHDDIVYEPIGEEDFQRIIASLETQVGRLKGEFVPFAPTTPAERDRKQMLSIELDRVCRYLEQIRDEPVHHSAGIERLVLAVRERRVVVAKVVFFEFLAADKRRTIRDRRASRARRPQQSISPLQPRTPTLMPASRALRHGFGAQAVREHCPQHGAEVAGGHAHRERAANFARKR